MGRFFSKRNRQAPTHLRYDLPLQVRQRILYALQHYSQRYDGSFSYFALLRDVEEQILLTEGGLTGPSYEAARTSNEPVIEHFFSSFHERALDFIEMWFRCRSYHAGQPPVTAVNEVLREEGIGYELTPWVERKSDEPPTVLGRLLRGAESFEIQYPEFIVKDSEFTHKEIVQPCLGILTNPVFTQANKEMLDAFAKYRHDDFDGALTSCGAAFESVLKTICDKNGWHYDRDKDTCSRLVDACNKNGLFPSFYAEVFKFVGTVRNRLSDAHGRGPDGPIEINQEHVEHLIHYVSSHIVFLAKLSGL